MSVQPFTAGQFRAFDSNGVPLAGGLLYTYAAGTTTPQATYTDASGTTPNANPVVLDASGSAQVWLTAGALYKFVLQNSSGVVQYTVDNYPASSSGSSGSGSNLEATEPGGRLTLTAGTPVTTADVTGATTVYYVPYKHDMVPLWTGTAWALSSIGTGLQQATTDTTKSPAAVVANSNYDLFVWNDSGILRLSRGPAWTSDTARGTGFGTSELQQLNGRWVNKNAITNGPGAQLGLYVGTVRSDGSSQINDSAAKRHVWNTCNRVRRRMHRAAGTSFWNYSTSALRQANGDPLNQLDMVRGLDEDSAFARVAVDYRSSAGYQPGQVAIGVDSTTAKAADSVGGTFYGSSTVGAVAIATYTGLPGLGRHVLTWLEIGAGADVQSWGSDIGGISSAQDIHGEVMA